MKANPFDFCNLFLEKIGCWVQLLSKVGRIRVEAEHRVPPLGVFACLDDRVNLRRLRGDDGRRALGLDEWCRLCQDFVKVIDGLFCLRRAEADWRLGLLFHVQLFSNRFRLFWIPCGSSGWSFRDATDLVMWHGDSWQQLLLLELAQFWSWLEHFLHHPAAESSILIVS